MNTNRQSWMLVGGFLLFVIGLLSLILSLVGIQLQILQPIESLGFFYASLIKLVLVITGLIMAFFSTSNNKIL
ncbi:MAG: hypothetical protein IPM34_08990 [Saprospiraceae bacterium]|nr:hypothetical protein [Saprospiraceae bacterium]